MSDWATGDILTLAAIAVGVLGIVAARRWGTRRAEISVEYKCTHLHPQEDAYGQLKVAYREYEVQKPYLVSLAVTNTGPRDITSKHFDRNRNLRIDLNRTMCCIVEAPLWDGEKVIVGPKGGSGYVELPPGLLKKTESWRFEAIVEGRPVPTIKAPLIDTDVISMEYRDVIANVYVPARARSPNLTGREVIKREKHP